MKIKAVSFVAAATLAALFVGCEWTSSDGDPNWSGSYGEGGELVDDMNFSGTYRNDERGGAAILTKGGQNVISSTSSSSSSSSGGGSSSSSTTSSTTTPNSSSSTTSSTTSQTVKPKSMKETFSVWKPNSTTTFTLSQTPDPASVSVSVKLNCFDEYKQEQYTEQWSWINDGTGKLNGTGSGTGEGKVDGNQVTIYNYYSKGTENDVITVSYVTKAVEETITNSEQTSQETIYSEEAMGNVVAITVSQQGSNLKFITSNGITMSGSIGTVNVYSNSTSVSFSAQFSASSSGNSIVGTLDDRTGQNRLDATWTSGAKVYDVNGFCPTTVGTASSPSAE